MKHLAFNEVKSLLNSPKKIVIIPHYNPDGDAIGSSLAIYHYFKRLGLNSSVITPNRHPSFLNWIPGIDQVTINEENPVKSSKIISESDQPLLPQRGSIPKSSFLPIIKGLIPVGSLIANNPTPQIINTIE